MQKALSDRARSREIYEQTQTIFLSEIGLAGWQAEHQLCFVKHYSDIKNTGRIDAEHHQPKYDEIVSAIKNYAGGWDTLGNLVSVKKCVEVGRDEYLEHGIPFVRVSNLSPFEITEEKYISKELYAEIEQHQPKEGEILLSKDATPGIACYLNEAPRKMIPSSGILRLKNQTNKVNSECLTLILNSLPTRQQVSKDVGGSVILHWLPKQVKGTIIPIPPNKIQLRIQRKVNEAAKLRKRSKFLLECAKRAVEMAIEQDENAALNWLEGQGVN